MECLELDTSLHDLHSALEALKNGMAIPFDVVRSDIKELSEEELVMRHLDDDDRMRTGYAAAIAIKVVGRCLIPGIALENGVLLMDDVDGDGNPMIEAWREKVSKVDRILTAVDLTPQLFRRWSVSDDEEANILAARVDPMPRLHHIPPRPPRPHLYVV